MKRKRFICCFFFALLFLFPVGFHKEVKEVKAAFTNQKEIKVKDFTYFEDFITYLKKEGMYQYNNAFFGVDGKRYVKVNVTKGGTLMLTNLSEEGAVTVLDHNKKMIGSFNSDDSFLQIKTKPGTYYLKLPTSRDIIRISAMVYTDHVPSIKTEMTTLQSGMGHYVAHKFNISSRRTTVFEIEPVVSGKYPIYAYLQKWNGKKWVKVTKRKTFKQTDASPAILYGLSKGKYRILTKTSTKQGFTMLYYLYKDKTKYKTKKSSALYLKKNSVKNQLYTVSDRKARWYRIKRTSMKKKHYLNLTSDLNSGDLKVYVYKKGYKDPIKKMTLKQGKSSETKKFRLKYGKGTYYVKVFKSKKYTNGSYYIYYSAE